MHPRPSSFAGSLGFSSSHPLPSPQAGAAAYGVLSSSSPGIIQLYDELPLDRSITRPVATIELGLVASCSPGPVQQGLNWEITLQYKVNKVGPHDNANKDYATSRPKLRRTSTAVGSTVQKEPTQTSSGGEGGGARSASDKKNWLKNKLRSKSISASSFTSNQTSILNDSASPPPPLPFNGSSLLRRRGSAHAGAPQSLESTSTLSSPKQILGCRTSAGASASAAWPSGTSPSDSALRGRTVVLSTVSRSMQRNWLSAIAAALDALSLSSCCPPLSASHRPALPPLQTKLDGHSMSRTPSPRALITPIIIEPATSFLEVEPPSPKLPPSPARKAPIQAEAETNIDRHESSNPPNERCRTCRRTSTVVNPLLPQWLVDVRNANTASPAPSSSPSPNRPVSGASCMITDSAAIQTIDRRRTPNSRSEKRETIAVHTEQEQLRPISAPSSQDLPSPSQQQQQDSPRSVVRRFTSSVGMGMSGKRPSTATSLRPPTLRASSSSTTLSLSVGASSPSRLGTSGDDSVCSTGSSTTPPTPAPTSSKAQVSFLDLTPDYKDSKKQQASFVQSSSAAGIVFPGMSGLQSVFGAVKNGVVNGVAMARQSSDRESRKSLGSLTSGSSDPSSSTSSPTSSKLSSTTHDGKDGQESRKHQTGTRRETSGESPSESSECLIGAHIIPPAELRRLMEEYSRLAALATTENDKHGRPRSSPSSGYGHLSAMPSTHTFGKADLAKAGKASIAAVRPSSANPGLQGEIKERPDPKALFAALPPPKRRPVDARLKGIRHSSSTGNVSSLSRASPHLYTTHPLAQTPASAQVSP